MKVDTHYLKEQIPYPNNTLPLLYYKNFLIASNNEPITSTAMIELFERNGYTNGWIDGIYDYHHFHSTAHEVLACFSGEAHVQFGGSNGPIILFSIGDAVLIPAGVAHRLIDQSSDFKVVGAYPDNKKPDMQTGASGNREKIIQNIAKVPVPTLDPISGKTGPVHRYW